LGDHPSEQPPCNAEQVVVAAGPGTTPGGKKRVDERRSDSVDGRNPLANEIAVEKPKGHLPNGEYVPVWVVHFSMTLFGTFFTDALQARRIPTAMPPARSLPVPLLRRAVEKTLRPDPARRSAVPLLPVTPAADRKGKPASAATKTKQKDDGHDLPSGARRGAVVKR